MPFGADFGAVAGSRSEHEVADLLDDATLGRMGVARPVVEMENSASEMEESVESDAE